MKKSTKAQTLGAMCGQRLIYTNTAADEPARSQAADYAVVTSRESQFLAGVDSTGLYSRQSPSAQGVTQRYTQ